VRPVNLIPAEQRRGSARVGSSRRSSMPVYVMLGALGAGVLCVLAFVLTSNDVKEKNAKLADLQSKEQGAKTVADTLRPYGDFAAVQASRKQQIEQVAKNRFDWDHALDQLARATPRNVWLLTVSGTVSPAVQVDSGGDTGGKLRDKVNAPAFSLTACTYSQRSVARMMARMHNLDGVTEVSLAKSAKRDETSSSTAGAGTGSAAAAGNSDQEDCVGSSRVTKFEILVAFGGSQVATAAAAGGVPGSSAAPTAAATAAAGQGQAATAAAGGGQ
jgi:Tfp pilus assembly protein PilN